jgi:hypothetical protein
MAMLTTQAVRPIVALVVLMIASLSAAFAQIDAKNWGKNTSGLTLLFYEGPRQKSAQGTILMYNLIGKGFPADVAFTLWQWKLDSEPKSVMQGVSFDQRGILVCSGRPGFCKGDGLNDPINIKATAALGEPKRMAVVSCDGKIAGFAEAVPFPIEASDHNCKLSVVRMDSLASAVTVRVIGFAPNQRLTITIRSGTEEASTDKTVDIQGNWSGVVSVPLSGPTKAAITVSPVIGQGCKLTVSFDAGAGSNHPQ